MVRQDKMHIYYLNMMFTYIKDNTLNEDYLGQKGSSDKTKSMDKLQYENVKTNDLVEKTY